jgi:hypothetical protein
MTIKEFAEMDDQRKRIAIFESTKIAERYEGASKFELFQIDDFFVEVEVNILFRIRRSIRAFRFSELPGIYATRFSSIVSGLLLFYEYLFVA